MTNTCHYDRYTDHHMHSNYSDGSASIDQMAASAIEKGLKTIAITDHMPLPFNTRYAMQRNRLQDYRKEILQARKKYKDRLTILSGMEIEYIPRYRDWIKEIVEQGWDMLLVSVHGIVTHQGHFMVNGREDEFKRALKTIFNDDIKAFCTHYYALIREAAATGWFDAAAHLDVIKKHNADNTYFDETATWYRDLINATLESLSRNNLKLEINMNGINHKAGTTYPSQPIIREACKKGIPIVLGSDAHSPVRIGQHFREIEKMIPTTTNQEGYR